MVASAPVVVLAVGVSLWVLWRSMEKSDREARERLRR